MSNEILIHGLKRKYGELAGELRQVHHTARSIKASMATIKATLKLFQAEGALAGVKPIAPPVANRWFGRVRRKTLGRLWRLRHKTGGARRVAVGG